MDDIRREVLCLSVTDIYMLFQECITVSSQANTCAISSGTASLFTNLLDSPVKGRFQLLDKSHTIASHLYETH